MQPHFKLRNSKWCSVSSLTVIDYSKRLAKALIGLRILCTGWFEQLLIAHTTLLEISCCASICFVNGIFLFETNLTNLLAINFIIYKLYRWTLWLFYWNVIVFQCMFQFRKLFFGYFGVWDAIMIHSKRLVEQDVLLIKLNVTVPSQQTSSFGTYTSSTRISRTQI